MKSFIKKLIALTTVVAVIGIIYLAFFYPIHEYADMESNAKSFNLKTKLMMSMPKNFSLESKRLEASVELTEDELKDMILSNIKDMGDVDAIDIIMDDNRISIYVRKKVLKYVPMEISLFFKSKAEDKKVKLVLDDSKIGRLEMNREKMLDRIKKSNIPFFDVRPIAGEIVLNYEELKDLVEISDIKIDDHKLLLDFEIRINSLKDLAKLAEMLK